MNQNFLLPVLFVGALGSIMGSLILDFSHGKISDADWILLLAMIGGTVIITKQSL